MFPHGAAAATPISASSATAVRRALSPFVGLSEGGAVGAIRKPGEEHQRFLADQGHPAAAPDR